MPVRNESFSRFGAQRPAARLPPMRAGEIEETEVRARRRSPAPTIRALAALVVLAAALLWTTGTLGDSGDPSQPVGHRRSGVEVLGEQITRPAVTSSRAVAPATSTTTGAAATAAPPQVSATVTTTATAPSGQPAVAMSCADALAYLASHQAPGFTDLCADGSAFGHLGVTCVDQAGMCAGTRIVHIACPAPFVYMNEAHNSWVLTGQRTGIDPYGQGSAAARAACASHR